MVNYNDGKWHEWHGGDNPVHDRSEVHYTLSNGTTSNLGRASIEVTWDNSWCKEDFRVVAFRVSKEYKVKPKEYWLYSSKRGLTSVFETKPSKYLSAMYDKVIHVREVQDNE